MKTSTLSLVAILLTASIHAESTDAPIDIESRKASVVNLAAQIAQRESRLVELGSEIIALDARIEKRLSELVTMLAGLRDSKESRFRVSQLKREAIDQLHTGIEMYARKRAEMAEKIRKGDSSALGDLNKIDQHNLKRVEQIVELTKSFPTHRDIEKYESDGTESYWRGYYHENTRTSEEWKQGRRDDVQTEKQRGETTEKLTKGIERMESLRRELINQLENRNLTAERRTFLLQELGQKDAIIERLKNQLQSVAGDSSGTASQTSLDEAIDVENLLKDARKDLRDDVSRLFQLYDVFADARAKTAALRENLEARKAWLEKNDGPSK